MSDATAQSMERCRSEDIAAYLDGELDAQASELFAEHLKECRSCASELTEQRRLLCALDFAFGAGEPSLSLPKNFAQIVAAHAESDMSGVRRRAEHGRALRLCAVLALVAFALLGGASLNASVLIPIKAAVRYVLSIAGLTWNALYDAGIGLAVVLRALGRHFIFEPHLFSLLAFLLFAIALALLPRLIVRYHRTGNYLE